MNVLLDLMAEYSEVGGRMSGLVGLLGLDRVLRLVTARRDLQLSAVTPVEVERATRPSLRPIGALHNAGPATP